MWCRFLEIARVIRDEMGHATFGYGESFSQVKSAKRSQYGQHNSGSNPKRSAISSTRQKRQEQEEDEVELASTTRVDAARGLRTESNDSQPTSWGANGIMQYRSYHVDSQAVSD